MSDSAKLILAAESEISKILAKLETETGMLVDLLDIRDVDVTTFGDDRPQIIRRVLIEMKRIPGSNWS